jgi:hypothetical protein
MWKQELGKILCMAALFWKVIPGSAPTFRSACGAAEPREQCVRRVVAKKRGRLAKSWFGLRSVSEWRSARDVREGALKRTRDALFWWWSEIGASGRNWPPILVKDDGRGGGFPM